jgi:hypothetical protein
MLLLLYVLAVQAATLARGTEAKPLLHDSRPPMNNTDPKANNACSAIYLTLPDQLFWPNSSQYLTQANGEFAPSSSLGVFYCVDGNRK